MTPAEVEAKLREISFAELADLIEHDAGPGSCNSWVKERGPQVLATIEQLRTALQYGFDLYGYHGPDGPWPLDKRHEFDRLARQALAKAE